jgi:nicotinate dehydrogenase subunit B
MTALQPQGLRRADYLEKRGTLAVVEATASEANLETAPAESLAPFVVVAATGEVTVFSGHVDLGTGIRTALAQIVAEELDVALARVSLVLGDTAITPDQGPTIASETIQLSAIPLRRAAAQARQFLAARAAKIFGVPTAELIVEDGVVRPRTEDNRRITYGELIGSDRIRFALADDVPVKPVAEHRIVGSSPPRVDLPAKATGGLVFVHDMRAPGMLHGRVVRPPYAGFDSGDHVGRSLVRVDEASIAHLPGIVATVAVGDFVGIVAEREEQAEAAMRALRVEWREAPKRPGLGDIATALTNNPSRPRALLDKGDVERALSSAAKRLTRSYVWPYQLHASIGPSAALADVSGDHARVWSGTQNPLWMRLDLALLLDLPDSEIEVIRMEAAGCYGRNGADDVTADAALLSRAVARPVRVQLTRDQEHQWEPKGAAQLMNVDGGLDACGDVAAYDFATRYPSNAAPTLALLLTGKITPTPAVTEMGDRTAIGPYDFANHRVVVHDMAPIARAAWLRGVSAMPNAFAHESYIDELAAEARVDPVAYRLRYLKDARGRDLVGQVAARVGWEARAGPRMRRDETGNLIGQGFAYARYVHSPFPGVAAAWAAWAADVAVNPATGEVSLTRVTVGQDSGLMINPDGVRHQIHGNVIQSTSRVLKEQVTFSDIAVTSRDWGTYPLLTFPEVPPIDVMMVPRPCEEPLGVGESASVPSAAAIANAIFDATGVRFREPPFTRDRILAGLRDAGLAEEVMKPQAFSVTPRAESATKRRSWLRPLLAAAFGAIGALGVASLPIRSAIAPIARLDPETYSAETIARGRILAHVGGCIHCHTAEDGAALAGGRAIHTSFGSITSTNITPDEATGIGTWSYPAFERAMREGIGRDGRHLFPAFPYTSFAGVTDFDLQSIYAYLMAQPAISAPNRPHEMRAPFGWRPLMAVWNALFHRAEAFQTQPEQDEMWNRGGYLVEGLGHCSVCHSPRNWLGAELKGADHLAGGEVDGWFAPPLNGTSPAPIPWTEQAFFDYLRNGYSAEHGAAGGPMAPVVAELKHLPDSDIRAMSHYLASLAPSAPSAGADLKARLEQGAKARASDPGYLTGSRIYDGACAVCHEPGQGLDMFGVKPSLVVNAAIHAGTPDTVLRVILEGSRAPGLEELGAMPGFLHHLDDAQIAELAAYLRARFAPDKPPWRGLAETAARLRQQALTVAGGPINR